MSLSIILSFVGEGSTDNRFIPNIAERLIEKIFLSRNLHATIQWQTIEKKGSCTSEILLNAARQSKYCTTLIIHSDSDNSSPQETITQKLQPGLDLIDHSEEEICKNISIVIPVTETEAWMLVDKDLLKEEINTSLSNQKLGLSYKISRIEEIADPKQKIINAIQVHNQQLPRKRRKTAVDISELYEPISQRVDLRKLEVLSAYVTFKENIVKALHNKNILN